MIQRIQSVYYALAILLLAIPFTGMEVFSFANPELAIGVTVFGNESEAVVDTARQVSIPQLPLFLGNLLLIILLLVTIFSYKKLKRQAKIGRFTIMAYLLVMAGFCLAAYFLSQWLVAFRLTMAPAIGFYLMLAGLLFVLLGNWGVKKDRKLLDSLNRLR